ncbi:hypothetical protein DFJ43DRAFT_1095583 [Lentinula guzmanii]|uniref:Uncharacterized protein n=1 Tax=Lentinula guzmanii TaxID=2804957 RepID=A0AA38J9L4_9AGAR|nr:hypothetical protein DFJ43DRAFT_1095583 [Lentinula guzmanii]
MMRLTMPAMRTEVTEDNSLPLKYFTLNQNSSSSFHPITWWDTLSCYFSSRLQTYLSRYQVGGCVGLLYYAPVPFYLSNFSLSHPPVDSYHLLMSAETSHHDVRGGVLDSQRQDASMSVVVDDRMMSALPVIRQLVSEWLQGLLVTMSFHQHPHFPDRRTSSYDGHPLSEGFPFPNTIQPALGGGRSIRPLVDLLEDLPLLSQREDQRFWVAREILASDFEVVLLQSELFHWVEELDGDNQLYWGVKAYLVMYGYHVLRLRWIEDGECVEGMMSPVVWELRWSE